jgi:hypothetical protein
VNVIAEIFFLSFQACLQNFEKQLLALSCLSAFLSIPVHLEQLGCSWMDFHEIRYLRIFQKFVKKIQVSLKSDKNNRCFKWIAVYVYNSNWPNSALSGRFFRQKLHRKSKHILYPVNFFWKFFHLWDNVEKYGGAKQATDDNIIRCIQIACWLLRLHTLRICNTGFPWQQWLHKCTLMLCYVYIACVVLSWTCMFV